MYVCICNAIRETDLRDAARRSKGDAEAIYAALGRAPQKKSSRKRIPPRAWRFTPLPDLY